MSCNGGGKFWLCPFGNLGLYPPLKVGGNIVTMVTTTLSGGELDIRSKDLILENKSSVN